LAFSRGLLSPKVLLIIVTILVPLLVLLRQPIMARLLGDDLGAANSRVTMAGQALEVIEANPVLGVGANNYAEWYEPNYAPESNASSFRTVHNKYLLVWAETGVIGLLAFLGFLFAVIRKGRQGWQLRDPLLSPLALSFTAAIVGQMAHMFFDIFHSRPQVQTLWLLAGLVIAIRYVDNHIE